MITPPLATRLGIAANLFQAALHELGAAVMAGDQNAIEAARQRVLDRQEVQLDLMIEQMREMNRQ